MPTLDLPLLELDAQKISQLNPRNVESLFGLWTVFNKCSGSIEGGKRYENLSWRLWNRETFCCPPQPQLAITPAIDVQLPRPSPKDVPELSSSVESVNSDAPKSTLQSKGSKPQKIPHQRPCSQDSALSRSRGKEKHLTPQGLEKMVVSISTRTKLEPLSPREGRSRTKTADATPRPSSPQLRRAVEEETAGEHMQRSTDSGFSTATASTTATARQSDHRGSDTSVSSDGLRVDGLIRSGSVVHGFSPSPIPASFRSKSRLAHAVPMPVSKSSMKNLAPRKTGIFTLGGSSGDEESSFEDRIQPFRPQRSSLSESLNRPIQNQNQKKASFRDIVNARQQELKEGSDQDEDAIETDEEDDGEDVTDSAIEDEDEDAEWEDDDEDSKPVAAEDSNLFKRVDSRPDLVSRRSMLTMAIHRNSSAALNNAPSRSTPALRRSRPSSPTGPDAPISTDANEENDGLTLRVPQGTMPRPIIPTTSNTYGHAQSPRTTRRNMLATELTESLRKNLLWERRQKSSTVNAVFKRRHTAQNMANLEEYPGGESEQAAIDTSKNNSWNYTFDAPWEYHTKGW